MQTSGGNCGVVISEKNKAFFGRGGIENDWDRRKCFSFSVFPRRVNFILEVVLVWTREWSVSVPIYFEFIFIFIINIYN